MQTVPSHRHQRQHGFTLIELMIVVVVVGVLAVLAILGYRSYTATARTAEAKQMTAGIRGAQEAYKVEKGVYASVSMSDSSFYPAAIPGKFVTAWGDKCLNCAGGDQDAWRKLAVEPAAPVMFGYATIACLGGSCGGFSNVPIGAADPFYVTVAQGDTNGDGIPCTVTSYATSNQLLVQGEGE